MCALDAPAEISSLATYSTTHPQDGSSCATLVWRVSSRSPHKTTRVRWSPGGTVRPSSCSEWASTRGQSMCGQQVACSRSYFLDLHWRLVRQTPPRLTRSPPCSDHPLLPTGQLSPDPQRAQRCARILPPHLAPHSIITKMRSKASLEALWAKPLEPTLHRKFPTLSSAGLDLMRRMLCYDPTRRISVSFCHPFLSHSGWWVTFFCIRRPRMSCHTRTFSRLHCQGI